MNEQKECKYCKSKINETSQFCPNCGKKQSNTSTEEQTKLKWYLNTWFICLLMLFSLLTMVFIIGVITFIISIVFIYIQHQAIKDMQTKAQLVYDIEKYKADEIEKIAAMHGTAENEINKKRAALENRLNKLRQETNDKYQSMEQLKEKIDQSKKELSSLISDIKIAYVSPYTFDENITSAEYKNKLSMLRVQQNEFFKSDDCIVFDKSIEPASKKALNNDVKQLLRCFNSEASNIIANVTVKNVDSCRSKLQKTYEVLNKLFVTDGISLAQKCLELKLDELTLIYDYSLKIEQEKEQQKAIKEQMIEEEKVRREIEREKAKLDKEETQFKNEISKLMTYLQKASDIEKQLYVDKIKELEDKVKALEADRENILHREQNTRAGFVYIISNIGSFGENVYKIGMTRRLEPMDRVRELGSASVPFEFDVHAMIFSDDAPALENILHKTFENNAVNKVNPRKEFYRINLNEIERVVKENHNATVTFTELAKAEQYRETLNIEAQSSNS